jgi:Ca2+-transporting ATPase
VVPIFVAVPGRVRLRIEGLRGRSDVAARLIEHLVGHGGIHRVSPSMLTGNLLVLFDPGQLDVRTLSHVIIGAMNGAPSTRATGPPVREVGWHALPATTALDELATRPEKGLSSAEAAARLARVGANALPEPVPKSALAIAATHLTTLPVVLLGGAALLSVASGAIIDAVVILAVVGINATVGFITERRVVAPDRHGATRRGPPRRARVPAPGGRARSRRRGPPVRRQRDPRRCPTALHRRVNCR